MLGFAPEKLVLVDETGAKTNMTRLYGRALRGKRLVGRVPHGHWVASMSDMIIFDRTNRKT